MPDLTPELEQLRSRVLDALSASEKQHRAYRPRWEHFFGLWSNYNDNVRAGNVARNPRDWDPGARQWWKREMGAELFIPLTFSTVETVVPRAIAQRPRMLVTPRPLTTLPQGALVQMQDAAQHHQLLLDAQQDALHYEMILEAIARDGFLFGIGVQKTYWKREYRVQTRLERHIYTGEWCMAEHREPRWDDPYAECIDPFNFFWDPSADSIESADYAIHRSWRNTKYCLDMVQNGRWNLMPLTPEDIGSGRGSNRRDEVWAARLRALGLSSSDTPAPDQHEVLEFHDGESVITVLDRQWPVQMAKSPTWHGELPFQVFRPTPVPHRFVGKGEAEPIESIQDEINTFRTQRLDNATLTLMQSFAYSEGNVDPADVRFGPGMLIPVVGDPHEFLFPIPTGQIPNAGYQEMAELKSDADRTSGISDVATGADPSGGVSGTATGAQLVEANASKRIARKARRLEVEIIASTARQWIQMNQRNIMERHIQVPVVPTADSPEQRFTWVTLTPLELAGEFLVSPEGGSSAGDNIPQKRQDAQYMATLMRGDPGFDQNKIRVEIARKMDLPNPDTFLAAPTPPPPDEVPPETLDILQQQGVPKELIGQAVMAARAHAQAQSQQQNPQQAAQQQPGQQPQLPPGQPQPA